MNREHRGGSIGAVVAGVWSGVVVAGRRLGPRVESLDGWEHTRQGSENSGESRRTRGHDSLIQCRIGSRMCRVAWWNIR